MCATEFYLGGTYKAWQCDKNFEIWYGFLPFQSEAKEKSSVTRCGNNGAQFFAKVPKNR